MNHFNKTFTWFILYWNRCHACVRRSVGRVVAIGLGSDFGGEVESVDDG